MKCPCCEQESDTVEKRRMNTQYQDPESNWMTSCLECFEISEEHWAYMWAEYWRSVL